MHTVSGGKGFPVLLMAGFPQSWYAWRRIMPILADHFYVVAIIQNCGHYMPEEQPEEIGAKMVKFFKG